jgi:dolichol-phosphate mannosyltransferase
VTQLPSLATLGTDQDVIVAGGQSPLVESTGRDLPTAGHGLAEPTISVIVPTFNEAGNIVVLLERIGSALRAAGYGPVGHTGFKPNRAPSREAGSSAGSSAARSTFEVIVVDDDSDDGTADLVMAKADGDDSITIVRRRNERGLSSAVLSGMERARGRVFVVIDADLQHDETKIPDLASAVLDGRADVSIGSRHVDGGGYGPFGRRRRLLSWTGTMAARGLLGVTASDPMSGFFAVSRRRHHDLVDAIDPKGFKILLEFLARGDEPQIVEVGYHFGERTSGSTKLSAGVGLAFVRGVIALARSGGLKRTVRRISAGDR